MDHRRDGAMRPRSQQRSFRPQRSRSPHLAKGKTKVETPLAPPPESGRAVTIHDVARYAGVASMTVSRVVNGNSYVSDAMRERVQAAIKALNYSPNLAARNTRAGS